MTMQNSHESGFSAAAKLAVIVREIIHIKKMRKSKRVRGSKQRLQEKLQILKAIANDYRHQVDVTDVT